jgi:hypothetical protein
MRQWLFAASLAVASLAHADTIQPGNWEFTVNIAAEGLGAFAPKPGAIVNTRCITQDQANDPAKVLGDAGTKGDCQFTNQKDTGSEFTFDVQCTGRVPVRGSGKMRYTAQTMDGNLDLDGDAQGMKFSTRSQISARRLGPCSS